ncbi:MAG: ABC transporter substrate-binding protein [Eubacteriales bacterium SKADARSKE-1]|nr:ABC transporter substrate-binding protein [Eubacteriales bacterium SKADARSKE-1]
MKKKILFSSLCLGLIILASFMIFKKGNQISAVTINVYNWGEFISDGSDGAIDTNKEFTKKTGIKVNYTTFQSNESLFAKLQGGAAKYDVIIPSDYMVSKLIQNNMLQKVNFSQIPNSSLVSDNFKNSTYDPTNEYSIPYVWGTVGLFYNKTMVDEAEESIDWDILWNEKYAGKILMFDNPRDAFAIAQFKLGLSVNSTNKQDWSNAALELKKQRPLVQAYVMDQIFDKMGNNEAALAPYYVGDAAVLIKRNPDIGVVVPKSGTNKFIDAMCIPVGAEHPNEAQAYINFMCEPDIALANVQATGYSSPLDFEKCGIFSEEAKEKFYDKHSDNLRNTQVFANLQETFAEDLENLWVMIKIGGPGKPLNLIATLAIFFLAYVLVVIYKKSKSR